MDSEDEQNNSKENHEDAEKKNKVCIYWLTRYWHNLRQRYTAISNWIPDLQAAIIAPEQHLQNYH